MAEVTIRFRYNKKTGAKEMVIAYESDSDALPHEHERDHRALAEQLLGQPLDDDIENVIIERLSKGEKVPSPDGAQPQQNRQGQTNTSK